MAMMAMADNQWILYVRYSEAIRLWHFVFTESSAGSRRPARWLRFFISYM